MRNENFLKKLAILLSGQAMVSGLGFVNLALMTNAYGLESLGLFAAALSAASILEGLTKAGFNVAHLRLVGQNHPLSRTLGTYILIKITLMLIFISVATQLSNFYIASMTQFDKGALDNLIRIFIVMISVRCLSDIFLQTLLGLREPKLVIRAQLAGALVRLAVVLLAITQAHQLLFIAGGFVLAEFVIFCVSAISLTTKEPIRRIYSTKEDMRSYFDTAKPMAVVAIVSGLEKHLDKLLVAIWLGPLPLGIYYTSQRLLQFFPIFSSSLASLYVPTITNILNDSTNGELLTATRSYQVKLGVIMAFCFALAATISPILASIMDVPKDAFVPLFVILLAANAITLCLVPAIELFTATGHFTYRVTLAVIPRLIYFASLFITVPQEVLNINTLDLGLFGIGASKVLQCGCLMILTAYFSRLTTLGTNRY